MRFTIQRAALVLAATTLPLSSALLAQSGPNSATPAPATSPAAPGEPVSIKSGSNTLNGIIEAPTTNGQHGGVVIVAGNANGHAAAQRLAKSLAAKGLVALTYEASSANPYDAVAAFELLKLRGDVQSGNLGVITIGDGAAVIADVVKSEPLRYAIAVNSTTDKAADPTSYGHLSQKTLVVRGSADAFSEATEKYKNSVEKKAHNVTFWPASDDDIAALSGDSSLLDRIAGWAAERSA